MRNLEHQIRPASPDEAALISSLAIRSKGHWGYTAEFLNACREELTYTAAQIASTDYEFWVSEDSGMIVGFYALQLTSSDTVELEALFVEPDMIGRGFGHMLMDHAKVRAATLGVGQMIIQSDPNATEFYEAAGGVCDGERESASIRGRFLPIFRISL